MNVIQIPCLSLILGALLESATALTSVREIWTHLSLPHIWRTASAFARRGHPASGTLLIRQSTAVSSTKIAHCTRRSATHAQPDLKTAREDTMLKKKNKSGNEQYEHFMTLNVSWRKGGRCYSILTMSHIVRPASTYVKRKYLQSRPISIFMNQPSTSWLL